MGERRVVVRICSLAGAVALATGFAFLALPHVRDSTLPTRWWVIPILAVAFAIAEGTVFHFEFRREAISFSLSEVPTAFALLYLAPGPAIAARLVGSVACIAFKRRSKWYKLLFNASLFAAETVLSFHVLRLGQRWFPGSNTSVLLTVIPATALATIFGSMLVSLAIAVVEGDLAKRLFPELKVALWVSPTNAVVAATVAAPTLIDPWLAALSLLPLIAFWAVMHDHGKLAQRFRDLDDLHGFVGRVGKSLDIDEITAAAATEVATLLRVRRAAVVVFDALEGTRRRDVGEPLPGLPGRPDEAEWVDVLSRTTSTELPNGWLAAPVHDDGIVVALIVVAEREGAQARFQDTDRVRLETLAEQFTPNVRKAALHQRIDHEARHDPLTGLPNRSQFERLVNTTLRRQTIAGEVQPVVMLMDLDRFKEVNDTLGHAAGDAVLVDFARRLVDEARQPFSIDGLEVVVTMSIGVAPATPPAADASSLLRRADIAMYAAKHRHTGFELYREDIDRRTPARLAMLGDLRNALEDGDLQVFLQPKLDIASGVVVGVEALARWAHSSRGWVAPDDFVPVAEETGLIKQMTDHVLGVAVTQLQRLRSLGHHLGLAVNLSAHDLLDDLLPDRVMRQLERRDVDPALLTLEITESSLLIDAPRARATIERLNKHGVRLSVDDFGTGYSSLSYLRHLPVSELKIDRSFVAQVLFDEQDEVIVRSIIELGHNLGMQVVAEGVETDEVLARLRGFSCDVAQGFGICRPVPLDQFIVWLNTTHHPSRRKDPMHPEEWPIEN
ncbi:MAG: bifunctional diguanylate cyclase/phosphodiesterase [Actinomycetota bacterium]